nr:HD domain-containing protein [Motiliproteus sediminis]
MISQARAFAIAAHDAVNQRRKYSGAPYWVHPQAVAGRVAKVSDDQTMIAAAWLHDVLEDTPVTAPQLRSRFGDRVTSLVIDLTNISRYEDGNRAVRKRIDREHTARAQADAKTIKLADIIDNVSEIVDNDPGFARIYLVEKALQIEVLRDGDPRLFRQAQQLIAEGLARLNIRYPGSQPLLGEQ